MTSGEDSRGRESEARGTPSPAERSAGAVEAASDTDEGRAGPDETDGPRPVPFGSRLARALRKGRTSGAAEKPRAWGTTAAHVGVIVLVGALVTRLGYRTGASLGEDSTEFALSALLLDGRIPYRTLLNPRPPGTYAFDAIFMAMAGRSMGAQHLATYVAGQLIYPLVVYSAARTLALRRSLALAAALATALLVAPVPGVQLAPALVALVLAARWTSGGANTALLAAGLAGGLELAFSFELAVGTLVAIAFTVVLRALAAQQTPTGTARVPTLQPLLALAVGTLLGAGVFLLALVLDGGLGNYLRYLPSVVGELFTPAAYPAGTSLVSVRFALPLAAAAPLLCLLARVARDDSLRREALVGVLFATALVLRLTTMASAPDTAGLAAAVADLPLLGAWIVSWVLGVRGRVTLSRWDVSFAVAIGVAAGAAWRIAIGRQLVVVLVLLGAVLASRVPIGPRFAAPVRRRVRVAALLIALTLLPALVELSPTRLLGPRSGGVVVSGAIWPEALAEEIVAAARSVRDATPPDQPTFVYPTGGFLYERIERSNPTSFPVLEPRIRRWEIDQLVEELEASPPASVLVRYELAGERSDRLAPVTRWLEARYVEVQRFDTPELWGIWMRRDAPEICYRLLLSPFADRGAAFGGEEARASRFEVAPEAGGRQRPVLVQHAPGAHFAIRLRRGSVLTFAAEADSPEPAAERAIDLVTGGSVDRVWSGRADGVQHRIVLSPTDEGSALVLLSPPGTSTLWRDPVVCTPR